MENRLDRIIDENIPRQIRDLQSLIRFQSIADPQCPVGPYGAEVTNALEYVLQTAEQMGLHVSKIGQSGGYAEIGSGDIVIAAFTHLDVVPAGDGWSFPPFEGLVRDGIVYGRGSVDNKGPALGCLYALYAIKVAGIEPNCRLRVYFGGCEETGMLDIFPYLEMCGHPAAGFVPDSQFPLAYAEKGVLFLDFCKARPNKTTLFPYVLELRGGNARNTVPPSASATLLFESHEKCRCGEELLKQYAQQSGYPVETDLSDCKLYVEMQGITAHANAPEYGENAVIRLLDSLNQLSIPGSDGEFIHHIMNKLGFETDGASLGIKARTESGELVQALTLMNWSEKSICCTVNIRYPYELDVQKIINQLNAFSLETDISVTIQEALPAVNLDRQSTLLQTLYRTYQDKSGDFSPMKAVGATYAKYIRNVVPYGAIFPGETDYCHQIDEQVSVEHIKLYTKIYATAFYRLLVNYSDSSK